MDSKDLQDLGSDSPRSSDIDQKNPEVFEGSHKPAAQPDDVQVGRPEAFLSAGLTDYYTPIDSYEGRHRYDPKFQWTEEEEKKLVRKIDLKICSWVCLMFFALQLDRANVVQALSDNLLSDLHLNTNNYNTGQTIFLLSFLAAELPSQIIAKKLGPDRWIPIQMISWSLVASFQAFISGKSSYYACRALIGMIEGGFIPDNILYLSYWYKGKELPRRLSYFWVSYQATSIVGAFLAAGILQMRGIHGMAGWRWLFALEGTLTGVIGVISFFYIPPSPTQTKSWFRGREGWFNVHEEKIMVNRIIRDDPSKGDMHNRQAVTPKLIFLSLKDWEMWPIYLIGLTFLIPSTPATNYITLILKSTGSFNTLEISLLTIPGYVIFIINLLLITWVSEKRANWRFVMGIIMQLWMLPLLVALEVLPADASSWARWALTTLLVGTPYAHAIHVAITSRNAGSVRTRTVASAMYNMCVQASNVIASNIYREDDKPYYRTGNKILLGITAYNIALFIATKMFYAWRNRIRDRRWNAMSQAERSTYLATTKDKGNKRLDFRFAH